jgi:hypothetical protein
MGRFKGEHGTDSEEFHDAMREAGPVECMVCGVRFFQGNKGQALHVCKFCQEYVCTEHIYRHPHCEQGR